MIEVKGLYKSFDDKTVLSDINASLQEWKDESDYRSKWLRQDGIDEVYRGAAYSGEGGSPI